MGNPRLFAIGHPVCIDILISVRNAVAVRIDLVWIGLEKVFHDIGQTIVVAVGPIRSPLQFFCCDWIGRFKGLMIPLPIDQ